ncbi:helix-turn-helix transcriptional regulator [Polaribacter porphyrae]|uniref:HTH araC/xylS-type domain-containing protein n=2 Tax=Polaribacter porphyrae TaxID=1137780 RepID=A0A2S7WLD0_9FLAO|nr:response regulator transcription factor [Polaribacter porphyrae]PQJ78236.1 hypothetical protein BTO18_03085 [Polaribacter porphyrae]
MTEAKTEIGSINISNSKSKNIVDRITPGLAIKYVENGKESYQLKNNNVSISKGQFFLIRNDCYFKAKMTSKNKITEGCCVNLNVENLLFSDKILNNDLLFEIPFSAINTSKLGKNLHRFARNNNFETENILSKIEVLPNLLEVFSNEIYDVSDRLFDFYKKKMTVKSILQSLFLAREFIYQNYKEKITLNDLVMISGLSKYHFLRLFSKAFTISPQQLQHSLRMEEASNMIKMQSFSLTDIACNLGYTDLASFSKNFKIRFGYSPSKYLNML